MSLYIVREKQAEYFTHNSEKIDIYESLKNLLFKEFVKNKFGITNIEIKKHPKSIKFRRWKQSWPLPKNISIQNETIQYSGSRKNQKIIKRTLWSEIESLNNFKKRWKNKIIAPRYWGAQSQIPYKSINNKINIKIHDNWVFKDYYPNSEDFFYEKNWIYLKIPNNLISINYYSNDNHNTFLLIPRYINLNSFFFEGLGLQQGDGTQAYGDVHISFTNTNFDLLKHQIKWFELFGIDRNTIRMYPELPKYDKEIINSMIINFKGIGINKDQFRNPKIGKNCSIPNIQIVFHNRLFKVFYLHLMENLKELVLQEKRYAIPYIKGLFASEGCVRKQVSSGTPTSIKISVKSKGRRAYYKKCLKKIGIIPSKDELTKNSEAVMITKAFNYKKILDMNLLNLHVDKKVKFENALKNYKKINIFGGEV
ncbi:hypothetical protein JXB41_07550 [Candidatus Woesearchaeota archaeon]|nr:hypothetical protein [Candidatus Woesearchaeota archaeon]